MPKLLNGFGECLPHTARKALLLLELSQEPPDAVILLRDEDGDPSRREGLQQARRRSKLKARIAIGVAAPMRECWILAGFDPQDDGENARLTELRSALGFDPRERAEKLAAAPVTAKRSAKRVLNALTGGDRQREADCWKITDLGTLTTRGRQTGLAEYFDEVRTRIVPLLASRCRPS